MSHFEQLPEFSKEFKRLSQKFSSLPNDLASLEVVLRTLPTGIGKNFTILHSGEEVKIVKTRLMCRSVRDRSIRIIYAHCEDTTTFLYIEIYHKGDQANEDRERIKEYLRTLKKLSK
jgi:hypothetical protein